MTANGSDRLALVVSLNVKRRNLTAGQRAIAAAEARDLVRMRGNAPLSDTGRAMAQENVETVKRAFEAWNRGDLEWLVANADPEVEIKALTSALRGESYRGPHGVRRWFADSYEAFDVIELRLDEVREAKGRVLGFGNLHWRGRDSGIGMSRSVTWLLAFRHGKVLRMEMFTDRAEALEAVGLRE